MTAVGALILVGLLGVVWRGNRRHALMAMVCGALYLSQGEQFSGIGLTLFPTRFLEVAGIVRVLSRGELRRSSLTGIDYSVLWLYGYMTVVYVARTREGFASVFGSSLDVVLCYFALRGLIHDLSDLRWFLRSFVVVLIPYVLVVLMERSLGHVPFPFMAGPGGWKRGEVTRCMGSFRNPDFLGTLGTSFLPLYVSLLMGNMDRGRAKLGLMLCMMLVWLSNSGGPLNTLAFGVVGWLLWRIRGSMRAVRWGLAAGILLLALIMKAPIWYILDRTTFITGGSGWHRAYLIDVAVQHLNSWWLAGMPLSKTRPWFPYTLAATGSADIANQYILYGLTAGLGAIALLIILLTRSFGQLGRALKVARSYGSMMRRTELILWGLGVVLTIHVVTWLGISYFDQFYCIWAMELAAVCSVSASVIRMRSVHEQVACRSSDRKSTSIDPASINERAIGGSRAGLVGAS